MNTTVRIVNLSSHPRSDVLWVPLHFQQGELFPGGTIGFGDAKFHWQQAGPSWPDGSVRCALVEVDIACESGSTPVGFDVLNPGETQTAEPNDLASAAALLRPPPFIPTAPYLSLRVTVAGEPVPMAAPRMVYAGRKTALFERKGRLGPVWVILRAMPVSPDFGRFWCLWGLSDPRDGELGRDVGEVALECSGAAMRIRHGWATTVQEGRQRTILHRGLLGDGQAHLVAGAILHPQEGVPDTVQAEAEIPLLAVQENLTMSPGPCGAVPRLGSWSDATAEAVRIYRRFGVGDPWQKNPAGYGQKSHTGDDGDFGWLHLVLAMSTGNPLPLYPHQAAAYREACRPQHYVRVDGERVGHTNTPGFWLWNNRVFTRLLPDARFYYHGKSRDQSPQDLARAMDGSTWDVVDRQHDSKNQALHYYLLTRDPGLEPLVQMWVEDWIGSHPVDSPSPSMNGTDSGRAIGRGLWLGALLFLATGRKDLERQLWLRASYVLNQMDVQFNNITENVYSTSDQSGGLPIPHWRPWESALAAVGLYAVSCVLTDSDQAADARVMATLLAKQNHHGWSKVDGKWYQGVAVAWLDNGRPLTTAEKADPALYRIARGDVEGYATWSWACMRIALLGGPEPETEEILAQLDGQLQQDVPLEQKIKLAQWAMEGIR